MMPTKPTKIRKTPRRAVCRHDWNLISFRCRLCGKKRWSARELDHMMARLRRDSY